MLKELIKNHFNIQIRGYQLVKTVDTLVFKVQNTSERVCFVAKLYKEHNHALVKKIAQNAAFLSFIKTHTSLKVQAPPALHFPLVDWENEKRYLVLGDWIEGHEPKRKDAALMQKMGAMMAQLHNAAEAFTPKIAVLTIDNTLIQRVKFKILARRNWFRFEEKQLDLAFEKIENFYQKIAHDPSVFGLIHSDLHFQNVLVNEDGNLSPIDFDEVAYGHYLLDIAITFNEIEDLRNYAIFKKIYLMGYAKHRPVPDNFDAYILVFQRIAGCVYLNWFLDEGNTELLLDKKLLRYARHSLEKVLGRG